MVTGIFKGKSRTSSSIYKKAGISQLLVALYILYKKYSFCLHLTYTSSIFKCEERRFRHVLLPFHFCILRILDDSPEITGSSSAWKFILPFCHQAFLIFLSFWNIHRPIPNKPYSFHIHPAHTHNPHAVTNIYGGKINLSNTQKSKRALSFSGILVNLIYTDKNPSSPSPIHPKKIMDLRRKQLQMGWFHLAITESQTALGWKGP